MSVLILIGCLLLLVGPRSFYFGELLSLRKQTPCAINLCMSEAWPTRFMVPHRKSAGSVIRIRNGVIRDWLYNTNRADEIRKVSVDWQVLCGGYRDQLDTIVNRGLVQSRGSTVGLRREPLQDITGYEVRISVRWVEIGSLQNFGLWTGNHKLICIMWMETGTELTHLQCHTFRHLLHSLVLPRARVPEWSVLL